MGLKMYKCPLSFFLMKMSYKVVVCNLENFVYVFQS